VRRIRAHRTAIDENFLNFGNMNGPPRFAKKLSMASTVGFGASGPGGTRAGSVGLVTA
jgi:hypothetical protein